MRLRCMLCREAFSWDPQAGWPTYCPKCGEFIGMDGKEEVVMPFISKAQNLGADRVYRDMEQKSELRAQIAQDQFGLSTAETASMKITNLKDYQKTGDTAFVPVNNEVSRAMENAPQGVVGMSNMGVQLSAGTRVGPSPRAGAKFMESLTLEHHRSHRAEALAGSVANTNARRK